MQEVVREVYDDGDPETIEERFRFDTNRIPGEVGEVIVGVFKNQGDGNRDCLRRRRN